jgi:hypothetical protein
VLDFEEENKENDNYLPIEVKLKHSEMEVDV